MPVIINEVEVLSPQPQQAAPALQGAPPPAFTMEKLRELQRELTWRHSRLVAD